MNEERQLRVPHEDEMRTMAQVVGFQMAVTWSIAEMEPKNEYEEGLKRGLQLAADMFKATGIAWVA